MTRAPGPDLGCGGTGAPQPGHTGVVTVDDLTPQGGSPADARRVEPGARATLRDADLPSLPDTLLLTGRVHVTGAYIRGNVDLVGSPAP